MHIVNQEIIQENLDLQDVRLTLERKFTCLTSFYSIDLQDGWLRRQFDNLGLCIRDIKISGKARHLNPFNNDQYFPIQVKLLDVNKCYDDNEYKKELGYIIADNLQQAERLVNYIQQNKKCFYP